MPSCNSHDRTSCIACRARFPALPVFLIIFIKSRIERSGKHRASFAFRCRNNSRKFTNYKDMCSDDSCICEAVCLLLFFQVIRVGSKYMHRQTRSYQGDLIQWVQGISLIGLSSISHAQKVSVSSYHTLLL